MLLTSMTQQLKIINNMSKQQTDEDLLLPSSYKHQTETRTQRQIQLTNKLGKVLTEVNLKRIRAKRQSNVQTQNKNEDVFHFLCLCGIPPFQKEFQNLGLPAQKTVLFYSGLKGKYTQQEYLQIFKTFGFEHQASKIRKVIEEKSKKFKIIVLYHSFGTFSLMNYFRLFQDDHRISGLIDIGGAPIRYYPLLLGLISANYQKSFDYLLENKEAIHKEYFSSSVIKQAGFIPFENHHQTILFLKLPVSPSFQTMFEYMRNLPKVLKLFLYGSKDRIFPEHLINEKAVYYSYVNKLDPQYEGKLAESYKKYYGTDCKNIQERFIFSIEGGGHSLHMQGKYNADVKEAIKQYIDILRQIYK